MLTTHELISFDLYLFQQLFWLEEIFPIQEFLNNSHHALDFSLSSNCKLAPAPAPAPALAFVLFLFKRMHENYELDSIMFHFYVVLFHLTHQRFSDQSLF